MSEALRGRTALITGASRGIGRAIALALARAGANVAVGYRERAEAAAEVVGAIEAGGGRALAVRGDVAVRADVGSLVARTLEAFGGLDVLVNNAGLLQQKPFAELDEEDWDRTLAVNLKSVFLCSQEALPALRAAGGAGGRIVNVASSGGQLGGTLAPHYAAAKAGTIALTRSLARLLAPGIAVNCVAPGLIETEMTRAELASAAGREKLAQIPLGRAGGAEEVAEAALFLAASARYVTGHTLNVNGGLYLG
jgi:3-oxoacyl-[acyl-carrier protein] reductase